MKTINGLLAGTLALLSPFLLASELLAVCPEPSNDADTPYETEPFYVAEGHVDVAATGNGVIQNDGFNPSSSLASSGSTCSSGSSSFGYG